MTTVVDVDFSLAMHNRTGKYFVGRDLIETPGLPLGDVYYWRQTELPIGLSRKVRGRLQLWQMKALTDTARGPERLGRLFGRRSSDRPVLHVDPLTVPTCVLKPSDIVMCHDVGPITMPHLFADDVGAMYDAIYRKIAEVGPHLVFVSRDTMRQFEELYPNASARSRRVIYPPIRPSSPETGGFAPSGVGNDFILTVGSIGRRKNQRACIEAYGRTDLASLGVQYVVCGGEEPGYEEVVEAAARTPGVVLLPYVDDAALKWLYIKAAGFVLVSRLEGFGMPVAEAISHNLVPVVTAGSVLEEVAGDGAIGVMDGDIGAIAHAMRVLVAMPEGEREARVRRLRHSLTRFDVEVVREDWRSAFAAWVEPV